MSRSSERRRVSQDGLAETAEDLLDAGFRIALVAGHDDGDRLRIVYLFLAGRPDRRVELECSVPADDPALRSLAYLSFPMSRFEREMADLYGIRPVGHPKPRRLVRHAHWPDDWHPMRENAGPPIPLFIHPHVPSFKDRNLLVRLETAPGTSLQRMDKLATDAVRSLRALPGIGDVGANVGRAVTGDQIVAVNSAQAWVTIKPSADYDQTLTDVRRTVDAIPGANASVETYENSRTVGVFSSSPDHVTVRIYGPDYGVLRQQAQRLSPDLSDIRGVTRLRTSLPVWEPSIRVRVKLAAALVHGIKPGDVRRAAATLVSGLTVGDFFQKQMVFEVVVWGVPSIRDRLTTIRNLLIDTPGGGQVRLGSVANVTLTPEPVDIRHDDVSRYIDLTAAVQGGNPGAVRADVQRAIASLPMPLEYHAEVIGNRSDTPTSWTLFASFLIAVLIGVFLLLQAAFASWRLAATVMVLLPVAVSGRSRRRARDG